MASRKRRKRKDVMQTALRGAAAGVVGGLAVTLVEREVLSRIAGGAPHRSDWDDQAAGVLRHLGVSLQPRSAIALGVGTQLLYAGLLGAVYAVVHEETRDSRAGRTMLDGALTYVASLVFPDIPQPKTAGRKRAPRRKLVQPANPAAAFRSATSMALGALT